MGLSDDGDHPVACTQTGGSCARVRGSDHDFLAFSVSSGAGFEALFDLIGVRAFDLGGAERQGLRCQELVGSPRG